MRRIVAAWLCFAGVCLGDEWFNHRRHASLKLECAYCHATAGTGARAGLPAAGECLLCHKNLKLSSPAIQRLLKLAPDAKPFTAEYDNLPDYVFFSHARHVKAKITCARCHGDVWAQAHSEPSRTLNMKACLDCHKENQAQVACNICHELGQ